MQGWMNETHSYDPETFHPSITHSVYVTLAGSRLRLAYPRANIPRWAAFDEPLHGAVFLHTHTYELANSKVSVLPTKNKRKQKRSHLSVAGECACLSEGSERESQGDLLPGLLTLISLCTHFVIQHGGERAERLSNDVLNKLDPIHAMRQATVTLSLMAESSQQTV